ncbi:hypothetical protein GCM10011399_29950 [Subtercola lobariae]|uniref:DUF2252 domain-containing protein n=1 Tax=Subtercola lobariae TaxID=1588641 RepID=A0A917BDQ0_9MICO|nr:hypothetical protein GCM10011399_29950 [Subtercola lobariae]
MTISKWNLEEPDDRVSQAEAFARGKALRKEVPRRLHAEYIADPHRDPLGILNQQAESRLQELIPLRNERMLTSPFAFYRGTAGIMAADLRDEPNTGLRVVSCGDAHVSNFGLFASPQRTMVFDLNDFDEAAVAPWEWDVKRLVASVVVGARESNFSEANVRLAARAAAKAYREGLADMMQLTVLERYYFRIDTEAPDPYLDSAAQKVLDKATGQARKRTSEAFIEKIAERGDDGRLLIREDPPVLTHIPDATEELVLELFEQYKRAVPADIALLLGHFTVTDVVMRVVGVGSVGTRCYILILTGPQGESLVLQIKEAQVPASRRRSSRATSAPQRSSTTRSPPGRSPTLPNPSQTFTPSRQPTEAEITKSRPPAPFWATHCDRSWVAPREVLGGAGSDAREDLGDGGGSGWHVQHVDGVSGLDGAGLHHAKVEAGSLGFGEPFDPAAGIRTAHPAGERGAGSSRRRDLDHDGRADAPLLPHARGTQVEP